MERLVSRELISQTAKHMDPMQFAYRAGQGVEDATLILLDKVFGHLDKANNYVRLQIKALASDIFKGKKENYPQSVRQPFADTRIGEQDMNIRVLQVMCPEGIKYSVPVIKYDRNGFRPRFRQLVFTQIAAYLVGEAKIKQRVDYRSLKGVSVSNLSDSFLILHVLREDIKQKGDLVLQCNYVFEALTKLCSVTENHNLVRVVHGSVRFDIQLGREGVIDFKSSSESMVYRAKNGHLMVV
ncbi:hypothetical protein MHYP_G00280300 [Metynnis hypsauchen]